MSIFRNINSTLIVSIGISALLCGAIVYYCNSRLNHIEFAIMRQNQVLSSFIANVQNEIRGGAKLPVLSEDVSTQEARESAENQVNKIVVSDDEDDEEDDDSSSESDTEDDDEEESDEDQTEESDDSDNKVKVTDNTVDMGDNAVEIVEVNPENDTNLQRQNQINDNIHHIKIVDIQELSSMFINEVKFDNRPMTTGSSIYEIKDESSESDDDSDDEDDENTTTDVNQSNSDKTNVIKLINHDIKIKEEPISLSETHTQPTEQITKNVEQQPLKYEQMRVDDLRKLVLDKQLSSKDEVKKLKKPELLFLLQKPN